MHIASMSVYCRMTLSGATLCSDVSSLPTLARASTTPEVAPAPHRIGTQSSREAFWWRNLIQWKQTALYEVSTAAPFCKLPLAGRFTERLTRGSQIRLASHCEITWHEQGHQICWAFAAKGVAKEGSVTADSRSDRQQALCLELLRRAA